MPFGAKLLSSRRCCTRTNPHPEQVRVVLQLLPTGVRCPFRHLAVSAAPAEACPTFHAEVQWNDLVEYRLPQPVAGAQLGVGRVDLVADGRVTLAPLVEDEEDVWVESHDATAVVVLEEAMVRILEYDLSQRQDKEGNPHGEHAHDVYTLLGPPSAGVYRGPRKIQVVRSSLEGA